jgi:GTP cyclohydrolase I
MAGLWKTWRCGMVDEKRFFVDVGMDGLPFPMRVLSKKDTQSQPTVATISIEARIMNEFEARWIDRFIQIVHQHRDLIGTETLSANIVDYVKQLNAHNVRVIFNYPFFAEKITPKSKEKCLVQYHCVYSASATSMNEKPRIVFAMTIPCITTYPGSVPSEAGGLFGQISLVTIEIESRDKVFPEDLVELVDRHALSPIYSFLTAEDQAFLIKKIHSEKKSSVVMADEIKDELARNKMAVWYSIRCSNRGMLHSYSTMIGTEKSRWVPYSEYGDEEEV